jgi:histidyl-tRNA synthetase
MSKKRKNKKNNRSVGSSTKQRKKERKYNKKIKTDKIIVKKEIGKEKIKRRMFQRSERFMPGGAPPEAEVKVIKKDFPHVLRGMKDVLPEESKYWDYVSKKLIDLAESYGFQRISTPVLEDQSLFEKATGLTSDVVEKQMYQFVDKGGNKVALRPELTPSVVRAYLENGLFNLPQPTKLFYLGQIFRYEKPQAGRLRQFNQFGLEVLGSDRPVIDAQLILYSQVLFSSLGIQVSVRINSLGCKDCRRHYRGKLINYFRSKQKFLCPDCQRRFKTNPLRILDCQNPGCRDMVLQAPQVVDSLCESCHSHFVKVLEYLDEAGVTYKLDPYLVRGLDYYTKTVFEFWPERSQIKIKPEVPTEPENHPNREPGEGSKEKINSAIGPASALGGGGRYDSLVESFSNRQTPAAGLAYGLERLIEEIKIQGVKVPKNRVPQVFFAQIGEPACRRALKLFEYLRQEGFKVAENLAKDNLRSQMETANRLGVKLALILGQQEVLNHTVIIRDMYSGNQEIVDQDKLARELKRRLK